MVLRISALLDQKRISFSVGNLNAVKHLSMYLHDLESPDTIYEIAITKDYLIVTTEAPDLRHSKAASLSKDTCSTNNINAYDHMGNHKWSISEIVGDIKASFWGGTVTTKELINSHAGVDSSKIEENHEFYICTSTNDQMYIIDLTDKKLIQTVHSK